MAPVPTQTYGIGTVCRKGWIYHTEVEMWAYHHGSSDHAIANSQTTSPTMC